VLAADFGESFNAWRSLEFALHAAKHEKDADMSKLREQIERKVTLYAAGPPTLRALLVRFPRL
jgi:hypothetical protein